jgi:hypothetical protein
MNSEPVDEQTFTFQVTVKAVHVYGEPSTYDEIREDIRVALEEMQTRDINPREAPDWNEYEITGVRAR